MVNVVTHPELKARVLAGQLHRLEDGRELALPFVYHDPLACKFALVIPSALAHLEMKEWARLMTEVAEDTTHPVPGYTMVDARVSYDLPLRTKHPVRLSVFGNNLLDKHPDETIIGAPNLLAGRQVFGQVEIHF